MIAIILFKYLYEDYTFKPVITATVINTIIIIGITSDVVIKTVKTVFMVSWAEWGYRRYFHFILHLLNILLVCLFCLLFFY